MKERVIKIGILSVVFILAVIGFSYLINRGNAGMTVDMGNATLPTISFQVGGKKVNTLVAHKKEMNIPAMRDTIVVYEEDKELTIQLHHNEEDVDSLKYEIFSLDGSDKLYEKTIRKVKEQTTLDMGHVLHADEEGVLKLTLVRGGEPLYYYTRVIREHNYHVAECLDYVNTLHKAMIEKNDDSDVKRFMEPDTTGDNTTLQHVTIHSDVVHAMWGELEPQVIGEVQVEIKEAKKAYTSVLFRYQVTCAGDNNEEERYQVKEFFKVAYGTERPYVLAYDRTMEELFTPSNVVLSAKGIILGIAKKDLPYKVNKEGTIVAYIQGNELWCYNKEEESFSLVFGFGNAENRDERNFTAQHAINILSMDNKGNMTFSVSGYMNRGVHEGESGTAVYYYDLSKNLVEEEAFIPSNQSRAVIEKEMDGLAYYNREKNELYVLADGTLQKIDMIKDERRVLIKGLQRGQYATSDDGRLFACQTGEEQTSVELWNLADGSKESVGAKEGEYIVPIGFVGDDFVYGSFLKEDKGYDTAGNPVQAMRRVEIQNTKQEIVKTYEEADVYILGAEVNRNVITIRRGVKNDNDYREIGEDYITNTKTSANEAITLDSYWTDLKQTQYRFVFAKGIQNKKAKNLKAKQVLQEKERELKFGKKESTEYFYVYGLGEQVGVFEEAGDAIQLGIKYSGVVLSPNQHYVWEDGNRVSWYRNFKVSEFVRKSDETTLAACVRRILSYEGKTADVVEEMKTKSLEQILSETLETEVLRFRNCSAKDMCYLMDKSIPVIALKDNSNAVLLVGYDAKTVTYLDPASGGSRIVAIETMDEMTEGSGHTFIAYVE